MKVISLMGVAAAAVLFTSCLGDSEASFSASTFAVGIEVSGVSMLSSAYGVLYSSSLASTIVSGVCYSTSFEVDLGSDENENYSSNGYYVAMISSLSEIEKGTVTYSATDTTQLVDNEIELSNLTYSTTYGTYVEGYLFLGASYVARNNQVNSYTLYWDRSSSENGELDDDGVPTYNLFMRVTKASEGTGETETSTAEYQAFKIGSYMSSIAAAEEEEGNETFNLKINYLSDISEEDSTDLTWSSFTLTFYSAYSY